MVPRRRRRARPPGPSRATSPLPFLGVGGMACAFFVYAATPAVLDAPWYAYVALMVVWLLLTLEVGRRFATQPVVVALLPVAAFVLWFAAVFAAARFLGWA